MIPAETLSSILKRAGGYTNVAFPFGGTLIRENTKKIEAEINERIYNDMIKFVASSANAAQVAGSESFALILNEFKKAKPIGRVTAEFNIEKLIRNQELDLPLEDEDHINIPQYNSEVYVLGEVLNPGARLYKPNRSGKDYIDISGRAWANMLRMIRRLLFIPTAMHFFLLTATLSLSLKTLIYILEL